MSFEPGPTRKGSRILWRMSVMVLILAGVTFGLWMHRAPRVVLAPSQAGVVPVSTIAPLVSAQPTQFAPAREADPTKPVSATPPSGPESPKLPLRKGPQRERVRMAAAKAKPE